MIFETEKYHPIKILQCTHLHFSFLASDKYTQQKHTETCVH